MAPGADPETDKALLAALRMLRGRDVFEAEIRAKCLEKGCEEIATENAIALLRLRGVLNDSRTAVDAIDKLRGKFWSAERIAHEIARRGGPPENELPLPDDLETARGAMRNFKLSGAKLLRKLAQLGFSEEIIELVAGERVEDR